MLPVVFNKLIESIDNNEDLGIQLDFRSQCFHELLGTRAGFMNQVLPIEALDVVRKCGAILHELLQQTCDKSRNRLLSLLFVVAVDKGYRNVVNIRIDDFPNMLNGDRSR